MSESTQQTNEAAAGPVKNIIVMVADGAGFNTLEAVRQYLGDPRGGPLAELAVDGDGFAATAQSVFPLRTGSTPIAGPAGLAQDPNAAYDPARNYDFDPLAGDNAAGYPRGFEGYDWNRQTAPDSGNTMSSMMTGVKTYNNAINVDGNGNPVLSLAELAASQGKAAGVVSTVQFSDATPASGGGAHNVSRTNAQAIAQEMFSAGVLQVIAGTGNPDYDDDGNLVAAPRYNWIGQDLWSSLENDTFRSADGAGWNLLQNRADIQAAGAGAPTDERLAMVAQAFTGTNFYRSDADPANEAPFDVPRLQTSPTLTEMTRAALNRLDVDDDGMFAAIEAGGVDRAMHANNFGRMIEEYIEFDNAVRFVIDWVDSPDSKATWGDTMLVVTADHDHLLFGPEGETIPYQAVQTDRDGDGVPEHQWFSGSHSNQVIPLFAYGANSELLPSIADRVDAVFDEDGERIAGSGRDYTDQAELGDFLLEQLRLGAASAAADGSPIAA